MVSYAYIHCKPDGTPFYVGKGVRSRYKDFTYRNQYHKRIVAKYGKDKILIGKIDCSTNQSALDLEVGLIKCLRKMGFNLANFTEGGEGTVGWKQPDHVKKAVADSNKRRIWSNESKAKVGDKFRGKKRPQHSIAMKNHPSISGVNNRFYGTGDRQIGSKNHMARSVIGNKDGNTAKWETLQSAANEIGVTIQAVFQAIKKGNRSKGWALEYAE